jgi:hypothetical protein
MKPCIIEYQFDYPAPEGSEFLPNRRMGSHLLPLGLGVKGKSIRALALSVDSNLL